MPILMQAVWTIQVYFNPDRPVGCGLDYENCK